VLRRHGRIVSDPSERGQPTSGSRYAVRAARIGSAPLLILVEVWWIRFHRDDDELGYGPRDTATA